MGKQKPSDPSQPIAETPAEQAQRLGSTNPATADTAPDVAPAASQAEAPANEGTAPATASTAADPEPNVPAAVSIWDETVLTLEHVVDHVRAFIEHRSRKIDSTPSGPGFDRDAAIRERSQAQHALIAMGVQPSPQSEAR